MKTAKDTVLINYQQKVVDSKDKQVVLRWARRTGKNTVISALAEAGDVVVHFNMMAAKNAINYDSNIKSGVRHISEGEVDHFLGNKPKRVFLNEPALFDNLLHILDFVKRYLKPEAIYLVGTPNLNSDILSSGFIFDAICARLEMDGVSGVYYSLVKYEDSPYANKEMLDDIKKNVGGKPFSEEMLATYNKEDK